MDKQMIAAMEEAKARLRSKLNELADLVQEIDDEGFECTVVQQRIDVTTYSEALPSHRIHFEGSIRPKAYPV